MKTRLGIVFWWLGALWLAGWGIGGAIGGALDDHGGFVTFLMALIVGAFGAALAWALCFIVAGSFWRAPKVFP